MAPSITLIPCTHSPRVYIEDFADGLRAIQRHGIPQIIHIHPVDIAVLEGLPLIREHGTHGFPASAQSALTPNSQEPTSPTDDDIPRAIVLPADRRSHPSTARDREFLQHRDALVQQLRNSTVPESTALQLLADLLAALGYQPDGYTNGPLSFPEEHSAARLQEPCHNPNGPLAPALSAEMHAPLGSIFPALPSADSTTPL